MFKYNVFILILFLTSCHVGKNYEQKDFITEKEIQDNLNITTPSRIFTNNWYEIFNDSSLNTLLQIALENNFSIKQGVERLRQSRYELQIYSKNNYPMIDSFGDYVFNKSNTPSAVALDSNIFKAGFDMSWEVDIWGKGQYVTDQYIALMKKSKYSLLQIKISIVAEVINNYVNLRKNQEKLRILKRTLNLQKELLQIVKDKYSAGIADNLTLNQAQYLVENTEASIPDVSINIENHKNALATLLGKLPGDLSLDINAKSKNIVAEPFKYSVKKLHSIPLNTIRTRPDIMEAEQSLKKQNAAVNEAIVSLYPSLNIGATFGYLSSSGHSLFSTEKQNYGYTPSIVTPIWHWQQLKNNIKLQEHIKEEYLLNYNEAFLTALMELKNTITAVEKTYLSNQYKRNALQKMQRVLSITQEKYKNGMIDFTAVVQAEQDLLAAQNSFIESNAAILQNITAFYKATGGGYNLRNEP